MLFISRNFVLLSFPKRPHYANFSNAYHLFLDTVSRLTGLEPATSAVTGRCSNQLNYSPFFLVTFPLPHNVVS